jgi:hypothetical protein
MAIRSDAEHPSFSGDEECGKGQHQEERCSRSRKDHQVIPRPALEAPSAFERENPNIGDRGLGARLPDSNTPLLDADS